MKLKIFSFVALMLTLPLAATAWAQRAFTLRDMQGSYAFSFQGFAFQPNVGYVPVAAAGMIKVDGQGNVTEGVRTISMGGLSAVQKFTCTLTLESNGTGSAICPLENPDLGTESFSFALEDNVEGFRYVGTTEGAVVLGSGKKQ